MAVVLDRWGGSHTTDTERAALRGRLTDSDRALIDQVLDRRLDA